MKKNRSPLNLYIDRLKDDDVEQIYETLDPSLFDIQEAELTLTDQVVLSGRAYLAKNYLVLNLKIKAKALMPCSICNESTPISISIEDFSMTKEIDEVKSAVWDYSEEVRTQILLKIPQFIECTQGACPNRNEVSKYLKKTSADTHTPFDNLKGL